MGIGSTYTGSGGAGAGCGAARARGFARARGAGFGFAFGFALYTGADASAITTTGVATSDRPASTATIGFDQLDTLDRIIPNPLFTKNAWIFLTSMGEFA
jgi:hypothetical protein